ncbi:outer membrane autotransporter protein [Nitrobacteraceae bacterium AZCC 1564]
MKTEQTRNVHALRLCGRNEAAQTAAFPRHDRPHRCSGLLRHALLCSTALVGLLVVLPVATPARAQAYNVGDGQSFSGAGVPASPNGGDTINLQGATATGDVAMTLPTGAAPGSADLTINGASGGSTVTIGGISTSLFTAASTVILNLAGGPITFTGANVSGDGGVLNGLTGVTQVNGDVSMSNNTAGGYGGAIAAENGSVSLATTQGNVTLTNNTATWGGAIDAIDVTIGNANGTITLTGNKATAGSGGAIDAFDGVVTLVANTTAGITLSNNSAADGGGAIYGHDGIRITGALTANNNTANGSGGAISTDGNVLINGNTTLTQNTAGAFGGAIHAGGGNGTATIAGSLNASGNTANNGGAIYADGGISITGAVTANNNTAINGDGGGLNGLTGVTQDGGDVNMSNNTAGQYGGAIAAEDGNISLATTRGNVTMTNNTATWGGAIDTNNNVNIGNANGTITLTGNKATIGSGGAIDATDGIAMLVANATAGITLTNNSATDGGGAIYAGTGVHITGALTANSNTAITGSGGAINTEGNVLINGNTTLNHNTAAGFGGAIHAGGGNGTVTIAGSLKASGNAAGNGGAIASDRGISITDNLTANGNTGSRGGALFVGNGNVSLAATSGKVTLENNTATVDGGAIYANGDVTIGSASNAAVVRLKNNNATFNGGAIYGLNSIRITGALTADSNTATNGSGGAINTEANVLINGNTTLNHNTAAGFGGAIHAGGGNGTVTIVGSLNASANTAGNGGAIASDRGISITDNLTANGNTASQGGALFVGNGDVSVATTSGNVTLENNSATINGGAIYANGNVSIGSTLNNAGTLTLTGNTAGTDGGAIFALGGVTLFGTDISSNTATNGNGGAVYAASDFTLTSTTTDTVTGNKAGQQGGAIWAGGNVTLNATGGNITFSGNTQGTAGTSQANAIYLDNGGGGHTLTLNTAGNAMAFYDPIQNSAVNGLLTVTATGGGSMIFDGSHYNTQTDRWSQVYGATTVESGTTFTVRHNAVYGVLAGDLGQATPTSFVVNNGTLGVEAGSEVRADTIAVNAGGMLTGDGTVTGNTTINAGTVSPGNSVGTLHINGDLTMGTGSTYHVQLNGTTSDRIAVTGNANIQSSIFEIAHDTNTASAPVLPGKTYTVLTTGGGLTVTSPTLATADFPFLGFTLSTDAFNGYLTTARNAIGFADLASTPNEKAVAGALDTMAASNPLWQQVVGASASQARAAFTSLSNAAIHANAAGVLSEQSQYLRDAVTGRLRQDFAYGTPLAQGGNALSYAEETPRNAYAALPFTKAPPALQPAQVYAVWAQALGSLGTLQGDGNAAKTDHNLGGVISGIDITFNGIWRVGLAGGYSHSSFKSPDIAASGSSDSYHIAAYGGGQFGAWGLRGGASFSWNDVLTSRQIAVVNIIDTQRGDDGLKTTQVFGEVGHTYAFNGAALEPFANIAYVRVDGGINELGLAAVTGSTVLDTTYTTLGLRGATALTQTLTARGTLGWRHAFGDVTPLATLAFQSGSPFTLAGSPIARDALVTEAGLDLAVAPNAFLGVSWSGQFADQSHTNALKGNFSWRF